MSQDISAVLKEPLPLFSDWSYVPFIGHCFQCELQARAQEMLEKLRPFAESFPGRSPTDEAKQALKRVIYIHKLNMRCWTAEAIRSIASTLLAYEFFPTEIGIPTCAFLLFSLSDSMRECEMTQNEIDDAERSLKNLESPQRGTSVQTTEEEKLQYSDLN